MPGAERQEPPERHRRRRRDGGLHVGEARGREGAGRPGLLAAGDGGSGRKGSQGMPRSPQSELSWEDVAKCDKLWLNKGVKLWRGVRALNKYAYAYRKLAAPLF